jgi:hypothetical protein
LTPVRDPEGDRGDLDAPAAAEARHAAVEGPPHEVDLADDVLVGRVRRVRAAREGDPVRGRETPSAKRNAAPNASKAASSSSVGAAYSSVHGNNVSNSIVVPRGAFATSISL